MRIVISVFISCCLSVLAFAAPKRSVRADRVVMQTDSGTKRKVPRVVEATIRPENHRQGTDPTEGAQLNAYTVGCGREIDQAGHAIPHVLGGRGSQDNIYPLNKSQNNRLGQWERRLGDMLGNGTCASIHYKVELTFGDKKLKLRPTKVNIRARCTTPEGKVNSYGYAINNAKPQSCEKKTYPDA